MMRNIIFLLLLSLGLAAQKASPDALRPQFSHQYFYWQEQGYYFIDTSLSSLNWYHQLNNALSDDYGKLVLMNLGGPRNNLLLQGLRPLEDFQSFGPFQDYFVSPERVAYYQVRSPLSGARYVNGYERGQLFRIYHSQNITKNWNFSVQYRRLNSLSFYINDQNKQSSFLINSHYQSPKGAYQLWAYFASEKLELQENGGIIHDSVFTDNLESSRTLLITRFDQDQRAVYNRDYFIDHQIDFWKLFKGKVKAPMDTLPDSLQVKSPQPEKKRSIILGHNARFNRRALAYYGRSNDVYDQYYFDQDGVYTDSLRYASLYNEAYLQTIIGDSSRFNLKAGAFHQYLEYSNAYFETGAQHFGVNAQLQGNHKQYFDLQTEGKYILTGPFANNFELKARVQGTFFNSLGAFAGYSIQNKTPGFFQQVYISNNVIWNQDLGPVLSNELQFGLQWGRSNYLRFRTFGASDYVYFGADLKPIVAPDLVAYQSIDLKQDFYFWNLLHLDNQVTYQIALNNADRYMPLPEWVNRHALYFEFPMFKRALKVLIGAEASYFSAFQSPSYSTATGQLYVANEYPIGDYFMVDAFAQFKVAKAVIFLKMQNLTQGMVAYNYWAAPHYPLNDRVFRVGVNWRFFN